MTMSDKQSLTSQDSDRRQALSETWEHNLRKNRQNQEQERGAGLTK